MGSPKFLIYMSVSAFWRIDLSDGPSEPYHFTISTPITFLLFCRLARYYIIISIILL